MRTCVKLLAWHFWGFVFFWSVAILTLFLADCWQRFDTAVLRWLLISIALTILSELAFTSYASVYDLSNLLGHYFKIASFYCVYKAIIETGLAKPYELLFRDLNQSKERYRSLFVHMISGQTNNDDLKQLTSEVEAMISESIQISRSLSTELSPPVLYEGGLALRIKAAKNDS